MKRPHHLALALIAVAPLAVGFTSCSGNGSGAIVDAPRQDEAQPATSEVPRPPEDQDVAALSAALAFVLEDLCPDDEDPWGTPSAPLQTSKMAAPSFLWSRQVPDHPAAAAAESDWQRRNATDFVELPQALLAQEGLVVSQKIYLLHNDQPDPGLRGWVFMSLPGYSADGRWALVFVHLSPVGLKVNQASLLLEHTDPGWQVCAHKYIHGP